MSRRHFIGKPRANFNNAYRQFLKKYRLAEIGLERGFADKLRDRSTGRKVSL